VFGNYRKQILLKDLHHTVLLFNPYHDRIGRFASKVGGVGASVVRGVEARQERRGAKRKERAAAKEKWDAEWKENRKRVYIGERIPIQSIGGFRNDDDMFKASKVEIDELIKEYGEEDVIKEIRATKKMSREEKGADIGASDAFYKKMEKYVKTGKW